MNKLPLAEDMIALIDARDERRKINKRKVAAWLNYASPMAKTHERLWILA